MPSKKRQKSGARAQENQKSLVRTESPDDFSYEGNTDAQEKQKRRSR